jgi:hypothetical protein
MISLLSEYPLTSLLLAVYLIPVIIYYGNILYEKRRH